ncbi:BTB/POZ domain-containing protein 6-A-like [Oratosquilla oratoria]|uniref:BTB/POZ domain-containing protein 6-A-like n=1 Tax=Oratosquilla oratoria TaxID=337810 RepID=UPI003F76A1F9
MHFSKKQKYTFYTQQKMNRFVLRMSVPANSLARHRVVPRRVIRPHTKIGRCSSVNSGLLRGVSVQVVVASSPSRYAPRGGQQEKLYLQSSSPVDNSFFRDFTFKRFYSFGTNGFLAQPAPRFCDSCRLVTMAASASVLATTEPTAEEWAWQSNLTSVHERLQYLYKLGQYSDLSITFPDYQENVTVHKLVLAMSSPVFGSMFMGASGVGSELFLHDSPKKFYKLLDYMYQDRMDLHSVDEALEVYAIAIKYKVEGAIRRCSRFIIENLTPNTTLAALEASLRSGDVAMQNGCLKMLNEDSDGAIEPKAVEGLKLESLKGLIQKDLHVSSELLVFQAVIAWGKAQLTQKGEETSGNAIRREAEALLREVLFSTLKCDEFIDNVVATQIFSPSESIAILKVIRGGNVTLIPESTPVSPSTRKRGRDPKDLITASISCGRRASRQEQLAHLRSRAVTMGILLRLHLQIVSSTSLYQ